MIAKAAGQRINKLLDMPPAMQNKILEQAQKFTLTQILTFINILVDVQQMFKRVDSKRIPLEVGIIKLTGGFENKADNVASCEPDNHSKIVKQAAKSINNKRGSVSVISPKPKSAAPIKPPISQITKASTHVDDAKTVQAKSTVALDSVLGVWQEIIEKISQTRMSIATYLNESNPLKIEGNILSIAFSREFKFHKGVLEKKENSVFVENVLSEVLNAKLKVNFIFSEDKPEGNGLATDSQSHKPEGNGLATDSQSHKSKHHDVEVGQAIKSTIEAFKGRIVNKFRKEY
ncbi:MAG TPA: hypothetical protein ENH41_03715 [Candidatus Omnitrophica bacterium]|nr:hypothetical protein [Candidatus Omnitrophota bacterium]